MRTSVSMSQNHIANVVLFFHFKKFFGGGYVTVTGAISFEFSLSVTLKIITKEDVNGKSFIKSAYFGVEVKGNMENSAEFEIGVKLSTS